MRSSSLLCLVGLVTILCPSADGVAQGTGTITGTITSEAGQALAGARVSVEGTDVGAVTDAEGVYVISGVQPGQRRLRANLIGYLEQRRSVTVGAGQTLRVDLSMQPEVVELEGIVAVGYGTMRKSDVTGAVASVNMEEATTGVNQSVAQVLRGRVPGVRVVQGSGEPGSGVVVRIRGAGSINAGNDPLYVIDGLPIENESFESDFPAYRHRPRNPLNALSPDDIESIEVLKDASATAIYGSRGANGVVLITTKRGQREGLSVNYDGYMGMQEPTRTVDMLDARQYMEFLNVIRREQGQAPEFTTDEMAALSGTNWQDEIFRSAPVMNHHLSFSGGGETSRFYGSLNYFDQQGVVISSGMERYTARMNLEQSALADRLTLGLNINGSFLDDDLVPVGGTGHPGVISAGLYQDPTMLVRDADGNYVHSRWLEMENAVALGLETDQFSETTRIFGNAFAEYRLLPGLAAKVNVGTDRQAARNNFYMSTLTQWGAAANGLASVDNIERSSTLGELTVRYERDFGNHRMDVLGGTTYEEFIRDTHRSASRGFISDAFRSHNLGAGDQGQYEIDTGRTRSQLLSYLGRVNYSVLDRYLFTVSFRADGSSRFGEGKKFGYFPSAAVGWRLVDEPFMEDQNVFSDLKLRASYGITGNQDIGNYNSLVLLGVTKAAYWNEIPTLGILPNQVPNPDLKWETTRQIDFGVDFGFLENRVTGSADYFLKDTDDLLMNLPIPSTTGFRSMLRNVGSVHNRGWELALTTYNISRGDLQWTTRFNASQVENEVTGLAGLPEIVTGNASFLLNDFVLLREGDPLYAYYGHKVEGIFQIGDDIANSAQPQARPGELKFRDVNGDGQINGQDRTILGSPFPDWTLGFGNTVTFGRFDFNAFLEGSFGNELLNELQVESDFPISFRRNRLANRFTNRWTPENPTNEQTSGVEPRVSYGSIVTSRAVEDASYLRLRTVELGYRVPSARLGFSSATVYVAGQNLWLLTDYQGYDPEASKLGDSDIRLDDNSYPQARIITAGVRLGL